jgi:alcohol dehydrogenase
MIAETGIPRTLREAGVGQTDLARMASDAMLQTRLLVNNPVPVTEQDAFDIYSAAF